MPKRYLVLPRTAKIMQEGVKVNGKVRSFKGKTAMYVKDKAEAEEINQTVGMQGTTEVFVYPDDRVERFVRDDGVEGRGIHHYFFGGSNLYSKRYEEIFGSRDNE